MPGSMSSPVSDEYLAGLFDGEGCVYIVVRNQRHFQLQVEIQMTSREPLDAVFSRFDGSLMERPLTPNRRQIYRWIVCGYQAIAFLTAILPFTMIKSEQIKLALEFQNRMVATNLKLSEEEIETRNWYKTELQRLKKV